MDALRVDDIPKLALKLARAIAAVEAIFKYNGSQDWLAAHSHVFTVLSGMTLNMYLRPMMALTTTASCSS